MFSERKRDLAYLGRAKVRALLIVSVVGALQDIIMEVTDKLIVGNMIGQDAVSGTQLINPIFSFCGIFEMIVGTGATVLYTRAIGDYDEEKKRRILGMASVIALAFGILTCVFSFTCQDLIFDIIGADGIVRTYGEGYFYFYRYTFLITPLLALLSEIVYIDGDDRGALLAGVALLFGNAVLSFFLTPVMGIRGASLGSALGKILALLIVLYHFFKKQYRIKPVFSFDPGDLKEMFIIGVADASDSAFDFLYAFLLEIFIVRFFGDRYLAVLAVSSFIYEMMAIGAGINDAMKTMLLSYRGDKNTEAMKNLVLYGLKITFVMSIVFIGVVWVTAPVLPKGFGIEGEMIGVTAWACRLTALSSVACVFYGVFLEYYLDIGRYKIQILGNLLDTLVVRLILNVLGGLAFGVIGIWIGESLCTYICMAVMLFVIYRRFGPEQFPFLLKENGKNSINVSFRVVPDEIVEARDELEQFLKSRKVPKKARYLGMLFLEDICNLIRECNPEDRVVNIDAYFICNLSSMTVVIWCDGEMTDLSDKDRIPEGVATYLISSLIDSFDESKYQRSAGLNRASFVIPYNMMKMRSWKKKSYA